MSWLLVAHVLLAGWGAYAYARSRNLGVAGSLVTGLGFMFAGKWMLHVLQAGHQHALPRSPGCRWWSCSWSRHCVEQPGARWGRLWCVPPGPAHCLGVLALGAQPQLTFYAGLFLALWTLGSALSGVAIGRRRRALARWAALGRLGVPLGPRPVRRPTIADPGSGAPHNAGRGRRRPRPAGDRGPGPVRRDRPFAGRCGLGLPGGPGPGLGGGRRARPVPAPRTGALLGLRHRRAWSCSPWAAPCWKGCRGSSCFAFRHACS